MSSDDDSNRSQNAPNSHSNAPWNSPQWPEDDNPFVAFRRFADEQISSMLQSVIGLPSMVSPPQPDRWTVFSESHDYNGETKRHREIQGEYPSDAGASGDPQSVTPPNDDDKNTQTSKRSQYTDSSDPWNWHSRRRMDDSFSNFFGFGSFFDRFWLDDHLPLSSRIFPSSTHHSIFGILEGDEDSPLWPVLYIMTSPYSPLQLERESRYRAYRDHDQGIFSSLMSTLRLSSDTDTSYDRDPAEPEWRDAFEDLLRVKYGKPMLDRESEPVRRKQPEKDWLAGLVQRGSLGDSWKYVPSQSAIWFTDQQPKGQVSELEMQKDEHRLEEQEQEPEQPDAATELDLYERFIRDIEAREREFSRQFRDSPILRFLSDERHRHKEEIAACRSRLAEKEKEKQENRSEDSESWTDLVSGSNKSTIPDTALQKSESVSSTEVQQAPEIGQVPSQQPHVVSTSTATERVRLADGSVHTKKVRTQRFADGREEKNESVETSNAPQQDSSAQDQSGGSDSSGSGWFWTR